jgi:hypothetical protein
MSTDTIRIRHLLTVRGEEAEAKSESAAGIVAGEFLPTRRKPILVASLGVSLVTFALLIFGQEMGGEFESVAQLFGYFGATVVTLLLVRLLPPRHGIWKLAKGAAR